MAQVDIANIAGSKLQHANITDIVGVGEKNELNDVMLIQALFKLVGYTPVNAKKFFGFDMKELPEPTGNFDIQTRRAIWSFQRRMALRLLNVDGKIHPANYKDRLLKDVFRKRIMVITLLNLEAIDGAINKYSVDDTIQALKIIAPSLIIPVAP